MIVTIDGPAGSGKSSTAREVARRLGYRHLDSGAFYRALTRAALDAGVPAASWPALSEADLDALGVRGESAAEGYRLRAGERDITGELRSAEVNAHVSHMAAVPAVRGWLLGRLRDAAADGDLVTDGRDMGSVVFPHADLKVFLVADPVERARRRCLEEGNAAPTDAELAEAAARLRERDRMDAARSVAPLIRPPDAVVIDTTALSFEDQVAMVVRLAQEAARAVRD